jgi:hypothetical protein
MCRHLDERTNVLVLDSTLASHLVEAATVAAVSHALVLKITLATLVANRAVQGVVGQQELHDTLTGLVDEGRIGLDNHARLDGPCARGDGLGGTLDFDEAHTTVTSDHELLVVTVAGDGRASLFAGLDEGGAGWRERVRRGVDMRWRWVEVYLLLRPSCHLDECVSQLLSHDKCRYSGWWAGERTDCELDLCGTRGGRGEGAGGIDRGQPLRTWQTAQKLLAHHVVCEAGCGGNVEQQQRGRVSTATATSINQRQVSASADSITFDWLSVGKRVQPSI